MLGFSPISARPISGGPFGLAAIAAAMSAAITLSFDVSGRIGLFTPMSAIATLTFSGTPTLIVHQAISSTITITFNGTPTLRVAGKPIKIAALPEPFDFRANGNFDLTALSESFTIRGYR